MKITATMSCSACGEPITEIEVACMKGEPHRHGRCMSEQCFPKMSADWAMCVRDSPGQHVTAGSITLDGGFDGSTHQCRVCLDVGLVRIGVTQRRMPCAYCEAGREMVPIAGIGGQVKGWTRRTRDGLEVWDAPSERATEDATFKDDRQRVLEAEIARKRMQPTTPIPKPARVPTSLYELATGDAPKEPTK